MKILFKISDSASPTPGRETVGDTNFKEHYPSAAKNMAWATLTPFIRQATRKYIIPFIGEQIYNVIADAYDTDTVSVGVQEDFLQRLQDIQAYYTIHHAMPVLNGIISDMGVQETTATEATSSPIAMWRYKNMRWEVCETADDFLDELLSYMEQKVEDEEAFFDTWKNSDAYTANASSFFRLTSELQQHIHIRRSRRTFIALLPFLKKAEKTKVKPLICQDQYDDLKTKVADDTLAADDTRLLEMVQPVVAHYGLMMALPHLKLHIGSDGIKSVSSTDGMNKKEAAREAAIQELGMTLEEEARTALSDLKAFLYENADTYTLWKDSDCYVDPDDAAKTVILPENRTGGVFL
jgi:hypothetical protein